MTGTTGRGSDLTRFARCGGAVAVTAALLVVGTVLPVRAQMPGLPPIPLPDRPQLFETACSIRPQSPACLWCTHGDWQG